MNLKDNKGLIIGGTLVIGTTIWILYNRNKKSAEVDFILDKIKSSRTENQGDVNVIENLYNKNLLDTKSNPMPKGAIVFNNKGKADSSKVAVQLASDFKKAIEGASTDTDLFYKTLRKIKSVFEFQMVSAGYTLLTKRDLMKDIISEVKLRKSAWGIVTANEGDSILLEDELANYLKLLPKYRFK